MAILVSNEEQLNKSVLNLNKEVEYKSNLQEEIMRLTDDKHRLNNKVAELQSILKTSDDEIKNLNNDCNISVQKNNANLKFLGMSIIVLNYKAQDRNCMLMRSSLQRWNKQAHYEKKLDIT